MRPLISQHFQEASRDGDPRLANIRRQISVASKRRTVREYITTVSIVALLIGIFKEAAFLVKVLCW